jgi:Leucine-rich repeat (LRR) protein
MKREILSFVFFIAFANIFYAQTSAHTQLKNWYLTGNIPASSVNWAATLNDTTMAGWTGITTNSSGIVTAIDLADKSITGNIPAFNLSSLQSFNLSQNQLNGTIPNFIFPNIGEIYLNDNQLTGIIPNFNFSSLNYFYLDNNALTGTIPNFNLPNLVGLSLSHNQLSGTIPNFNYSNLFELNLSDNQLTGTIPNFNLPLLNILNLSNNQISGTIPNFSNSPYLTSLNLSFNQLTGSIPNFNLPDLATLILGYNSLTGTIPNFNLPELFEIYLDHNQLLGTIPNFDFPKIYFIDLSNNQLTGSIPNFKLKGLNYLYLNSNQLSGCIPAGIKVNCPLIGPDNGGIANNSNLTNQSWENYWKNATGACPTPTIVAKLFLNHVDTTTLLMDNYMSTLQSFPLEDPFSNMPFSSNFTHKNNFTKATISPAVLALTGNEAIVDWVFLELRTGSSGSTSVVYTKAALLQRNGNIISADSSALRFENAVNGNYFISVRHRNCLGFRTLNAYSLSSTPTILNFTNNSIPLYGATPNVQLSGTVAALNGGDANFDGSIDAFDTITWELQNGLFDDYGNNSDYNFDGSVDAFDTITWELNNGKFEELD